MRLLRLQLENYRSHAALDLDLDEISCAAIVGPNGAGKTSILSAVDFALNGGRADELLSRRADKGGVTLTLEQAGKVWRVNRGRERGRKSWCVVEQAVGSGFEVVDERDVVHGEFKLIAMRTIAESQAYIEQAITGMDQDAFRATVYAPQGEVGVLASLGPGQRKALLGGLLGLDQYETWREKAAVESRGARSEAESAQERLGDLEARLGDAKLRFENTESVESNRKLVAEELTEQETELDAAIKRESAVEQVHRRQQLVAQMQSIKDRAKQIKERATRRESVAAAIKETEALAADLLARQAEKDAARDAELRVEAAEEAVKAALTHVVRGENAVTEAAQLLERAEAKVTEVSAPGAKCPSCGQEIAGEHREKALADVHGRVMVAQEAKAKAEVELAELKEAATAAKAEVPPPGPKYDEAAYNRAFEASARLRQLQGELAGLQDEETTEDLQAQWKKLGAEAQELPKEVPTGPSPTAVRERIATCRESLQRLDDTLSNDAAARKESAELEEQQGDLKTRATEAEINERAYAVVAKAFSRDGIPAMILDNAVGGIEAATNETLEQLGVEMSVRLVTQRATKAGGLTETLDILVDDGTTEAPLETFSGGERFRIHISLRLGMATVLGGCSDLLLIDETTDLDTEGVESLARVLNQLSDSGMQCILVSHIRELVDLLPQTIQVSRSDQLSSSAVAILNA